MRSEPIVARTEGSEALNLRGVTVSFDVENVRFDTGALLLAEIS